jgi:predicted transcriptional regulator
MTTTVGVIMKCPKTGKKSFPDEATGVKWEEENYATYGGTKKFVYACEDCDAWHLTSTPPGNNSIAQMNYESGAPVKKGLDTEEVVRLRKTGLSVQQIADEFKVSLEAVKYHIRKSEGKITTKTNRSSPQLMTYEQHNSLWAELETSLVNTKRHHHDIESTAQAEIDRIREIEDRLFEARRLKIDFRPDGVVILRKYDREFDLTRAELLALMDKITRGGETVQEIHPISTPD